MEGHLPSPDTNLHVVPRWPFACCGTMDKACYDVDVLMEAYFSPIGLALSEPTASYGHHNRSSHILSASNLYSVVNGLFITLIPVPNFHN